jgi:hypothetical protein
MAMAIQRAAITTIRTAVFLATKAGVTHPSFS